MISRIIDTKDIKIINDSTQKPQNIFWRFHLIRIINYFIRMLKICRNKLDMECHKVQIIRDMPTGEKIQIIDSQMDPNKKPIYIKDILKHHLDCYVDNLLTGIILLQFKINNTNDKLLDDICLKNYMIKYKDRKKYYHNTLENIILFNNMEIDTDNAIIIINLFKNGKKICYNIPYNECKNKHINYFYELE